MTHTRDEERRRALNLGLLRDERDREVQQAGQGKAAAALLTVSQLLAALCVLQGDPAWTVLLSLTFVAGAARSFHQFACDRAGLYLALGLAASAAALALCGWYVFHAPALSLGRLAGLLLLFLALSAVTALVFLGLTLGAFWLKFQVQHMDADKWTAYFEGLSTPALLVRLGLLMGAALLLTSALAALVFQWTGFSQPIQLALVFCVISALRLARKFGRRREELLEKLLRLKPARRTGAAGESDAPST